MYNNFIDKYSDLKRAYVNLMKDSKRIYDENDNMERKYNEMCGLYDEISLKLAKAIIKINRLERMEARRFMIQLSIFEQQKSMA